MGNTFDKNERICTSAMTVVHPVLQTKLEKRPHSGMSDEDLEKLVPWSDEARAYCGYAQQIACI